MSDPIDLDALAALLTDATPGPWKVILDHLDPETGEGGDPMVVHVMESGARHYIASDSDDADAALIAAMRNALPALINEIRTLRAKACNGQHWRKVEDDEDVDW